MTIQSTSNNIITLYEIFLLIWYFAPHLLSADEKRKCLNQQQQTSHFLASSLYHQEIEEWICSTYVTKYMFLNEPFRTSINNR